MGIRKLLLQLSELLKLGSIDGSTEMSEKFFRKSIGQTLLCGTSPVYVRCCFVSTIPRSRPTKIVCIHFGSDCVHNHLLECFLFVSLCGNRLLRCQTRAVSLQADSVKYQAGLFLELEKNIKRAERAQEDAKKWETHKLIQSTQQQWEGASDKPVVTHEKPLVRIAIKHLMLAMKKLCPAEGVAGRMLKGCVAPSAHRRNYLQSLYDHVKTLSCFVEDCLEKPKGGLDGVTNLLDCQGIWGQTLCVQ